MRKSTSLLAAAVASLVVGLGLATGSNAQAFAPSSMSDEAYCQSLLKELRDHGWGTVRGLPVGNATAVAIAQCQEGDSESAIPVLEQQMRDRKINLPPRS
jgi:hypothetical protein